MLFINELRFCWRQPLLLVGFILMPLFAYMLSVGLGVGDVSQSKKLIMTQTGLIMLVLPIALAVLSPVVMLRDNHADMQELINVTPVIHRTRWLLRFNAVFALAAVAFIISFMIMLVSHSIQLGFRTELLSISLLNILLLVLPALLFTSAIALWLSQRFASGVAIYVCFALLFLGYLMLASMTGSPTLAGSAVVSQSLYNTMLWLDPYGVTALINHIDSANRYLNPPLLVNRCIYLALSAGLVYHALKVLPKKHPNNGVNKPSKASTLDSLQVNQVSSNTQGQYQACSAKNIPVSPIMTLIKTTFGDLLHNPITRFLLCLWPLMIFNETLSGIDFVEPMAVIAPNSIDALNRVAFDVVPTLGAFLLALWSWQICWREKTCHIAELIAASPIKNRQLLVSHLAVMWLMVSVLILLTFIASSVAEWMADSDWFFSHYVIQLGLSGLPLVLLGSIFIGIHHLCRSKAVSAGLSALILLVKFTPVTTSFGLTHTLWNIAGSPLQEPDNFWGYSNSLSVYLPYMAFWLLTTVSVALFAIRYSHRGTSFNSPSIKSSRIPVLVLLAINLAIGLSLHMALIDEKPLMSSDKRDAWKAQYETRFGNWLDQPQPSIVQIDSNVDIYPHQQLAKFKITFTLENRTNTDIKKILIGRFGNESFPDIRIKDAMMTEFEPELAQAVYQFSTPMQPGEQRIVDIAFNYKTPQLWPVRSHQFVKPELTYLRSVPLLPTIGYQPTWQLRDEQTRHEYGLEPLDLGKPSELFKQGQQLQDEYQWTMLNTKISTVKGQYAIAQGQLTSRTEDNGRVYFHYQTRQPVRNIPAWLSVPDSMLTASVPSTGNSPITLNLFSTTKNAAAQLNLKAMIDTLNWFSDNIAPYRASQLSLVALPEIGTTGYALPQIILIGDRVGFRATPSASAGFDQRYRRAVHETAHQWFGHDLGNGVLKDSTFLVESMAKYVELVLIEQTYGRQAMLALVDYERGRFNNVERGNVQKTLALVDATQPHDMYSRATLVFYQLRNVLGDKIITGTLKQLWQQHAYPNTPATSMDFVRALKQQSPKEQQQLIDDMLLGTDLSKL
ncbi:M1 family aminopeptidase [Neptunicella sp. SCSIO 80796]|uniref:ABC transporter permease/M1 family aminopeptidase n=1 Tax=Neptunicella plasticusilytica TaxID=3117012 RepID=UPI003A4D46C8